MRRSVMVMVLVMALPAACPQLLAGAETKYKPCSLLTAAELEAALQGKVARADERDSTIPDGPFQGEIMSTCDWVVGSRSVTLSVTRGPTNPLEQATGMAALRVTEARLRQQGWTVEPGNVPGADCASLKPPAGERTALPGSSCVMVSNGLAFLLGVNGRESVTVQQVKALADKVAGRL